MSNTSKTVEDHVEIWRFWMSGIKPNTWFDSPALTDPPVNNVIVDAFRDRAVEVHHNSHCFIHIN